MYQKIKHIVSESTFFIFSFYFSRGLRIAFVMLTPIILGILFNRLDIGVLASSGALVAGIGDNPGTIKIKLYTQSIGAVFYFLVVLISQLLLPYTSHVISFGLWVTFSGFFFALLFIYGSRAVSISTSALLCIVYACSFQSHDIVINTLAMMSGIVFYGIVSLGLWRIQPYRVIEQKLSENIKQLGEYTDLLYHYFLIKSNSPEKKQKLNDILIKIFEKQEKIHTTHEDIRENLFRLRINAKSFSAKGRRMTLIFSALIDLYEQLISLNIQDDKLIYSLEISGLKQDFTTGLLNMRLILDGINWSINLHKKVTITIDTFLLSKFKEHILNIENGYIDCRDVNIHALKHVRFIFRSFYKQTQIIKSIINGNFSNEKTAYEDLQLEKFTREYNYNFTTLKANLNLRSNIFRHALRVSMAILLSYFICITLEIKYFSWVYLTIILILKPVYGNTKNYAIQRLQGTAAGAVITLLLLLLTQNVYVITFLTVICIVGAYSFIPINYKVGVAFVTIFVILLIFLEHQGSDNWINIYHRLGGTAIAVIIAFILSFLFLPTWEYKILPTLISKLLNYNLNYFKKLTFNLQHENKLSETEIKLARKDVLLGTSNLSSSFQRIISEPSLSKDYKSNIYNIQTLINLLSTRISALRTYTFTSQKNTITETDNRLIQLIEQTLSNCTSLIQNRKPGEESNWQEEEFNLNLNNQSLNTYQLKEIYILTQQIYTYVKKLKEFHEWKNSQFEFSL